MDEDLLNEYTLKDLKSIATKYKLKGRGKKRSKEEFIKYLLDTASSKEGINKKELQKELKSLVKGKSTPKRSKTPKKDVSKPRITPKKSEPSVVIDDESLDQNIVDEPSQEDPSKVAFEFSMSKELSVFFMNGIGVLKNVKDDGKINCVFREKGIQFTVTDEKDVMTELFILNETFKKIEFNMEYLFSIEINADFLYILLKSNEMLKNYNFNFKKDYNQSKIKLEIENGSSKQEYTIPFIESTDKIYDVELDIDPPPIKFMSKEFFNRLSMLNDIGKKDIEIILKDSTLIFKGNDFNIKYGKNNISSNERRSKQIIQVLTSFTEAQEVSKDVELNIDENAVLEMFFKDEKYGFLLIYTHL